MNGSNPIFPLAGIGQTASVQTVQTSESENSAFAENLTAALASSSLTPALPNQQKAETPMASFDGSLAVGSLDAAISESGDTVLADHGRTAGAPRSVGNTDLGAIGGSAMRSEDGSSAENLHTGDLVNAFGRPETAPEFGRVAVDFERAGREPSTAAVADAPSFPAARHAKSVPVDAAAGRPPGPGLEVTDTDVQPVVEAPSDSEALQPMIVSARRTTAPVREPSEPPMHVFEERAPRVVPKDTPSSQAPSANQPLDEDHPSTISVSALAREDKAGTIPSPPSWTGVQVVEHYRSAPADRLDPLRHVVDAPAGTSSQQAMSRLSASSPDSALPAVRSPAGGQKGETADPVIRSLTPEANPRGPADDRPTIRKRDTAPVVTNEAIGKSGLSILSGGTSQVAVADGFLRPSGEFGGFDRLQPVLQAEGAALDTARFEASSSLSQIRAQTPTVPAPAGAQIALQIVRSLPEGIERFSLRLQPAELGSVDIQLNFEGGGRLSALIMAERPETLELLQRDSRILERSLGDSGLKLSSDGLTFTLKQDQQQQQQGQSFHEQAHAREAAFRAGRAYDGASDAEPAPPIQRIDRLRLLDIRT